MSYFISVTFKNNAVPYCFETEFDNLKVGNEVICDTVRGLELGVVCKGSLPLSQYKRNLELKPISRIATEEDKKQYQLNKKKEEEYALIFKKEQEKLNLGMKLLFCEVTLDQSKVIFSFAAENRVDFRELLKVLITKIKAKLELRQIPPRDRAQQIGGLGPCGRPTCCTLFLREFEGITTNMIKNQMLIGNTAKLSGLCDKLLCCLKYENDNYTEAKKEYPPLKTIITIDGINYTVTGYNLFAKLVKLKNPVEGEKFIELAEVKKILKKQNKNEKQ